MENVHEVTSYIICTCSPLLHNIIKVQHYYMDVMTIMLKHYIDLCIHYNIHDMHVHKLRMLYIINSLLTLHWQVLVAQQPAVVPRTHVHPGTRPKNYILISIINLLACFFILGVIALAFSLQVETIVIVIILCIVTSIYQCMHKVDTYSSQLELVLEQCLEQ